MMAISNFFFSDYEIYFIIIMPRLTRQSKPEAASNANGETQSSPTVPPIAEVTSETINGMTDSIPIKRGRGKFWIETSIN